ncbi:MAG: DNA topoisomerase IV subunit A [Alphaproteobacteria bacterium]
MAKPPANPPASAPIAATVRDEPLADALGERYLAYALSTIMGRSLPDVRDGLKPVHRRLLYAMRELRLAPNAGYKKSARVVGDVMGKFHPHGDQAIYDTLVRLAQGFTVRYPLIDGQGNFGSQDGDNAAAMRYTEARLTVIAELLLEGLDEDAADFRDTYDGEGQEPAVLPARFPNLLANGASGIAVGLATSIPPHNILELLDAALHLIKSPNARLETLLRYVRGPDFPTGGLIAEAPEAIAEAYCTGRGSFRLRARWHKEDIGRGSYEIIVTELPVHVSKSRLVSRIADLLDARKLPLLEDVRDESADDVRLVLQPKSRNVDGEVLMEHLFRQSDLEVRVPLNMNVVDGTQTPVTMNLAQALQAWLDHRHDVLVRRTTHRLEAIGLRIEILEGFRIAFANLDAVIAIIRKEDEPKPVLRRRFRLSDVQAEAILNMRLRSLRRLEEKALAGELAELRREEKALKALLRGKAARWAAIAADITDLKSLFGARGRLAALGVRRTEISSAPSVVALPVEAEVPREPLTIICSAKGWVRTVRGHAAADELRYKEGDRGCFVLHGHSTDKVLVLATNGRIFTLDAHALSGGRGQGEPVRLLLGLTNDADVATMLLHRPGGDLLVASSDGRGFLVAADDVLASTRAGKQVLNVTGSVEARLAAPADGDSVAVLGDNRRLLIFPRDQLPVMSRGRGNILQRYRDGGLADACVFTYKDGLTWSVGAGRRHVESDLRIWRGERGQAGRVVPRGFPRANRFG